MRHNLTPEFVDSLKSPFRGEEWVGDIDVKGFGVRLWSSSGGGNIAYAIRVRDADGTLRRETFSIWSDWRSRERALDTIRNGGEIGSLGTFLPDARNWARDRIRSLKGKKTRVELRHERRHRISATLLSMTLEQMANRNFNKLKRARRNDAYAIQLHKLLFHLSVESRSTPLMQMNLRQLASEIADPNLPIFQSRTLQSFVGQMYTHLYRWHGPAGRKHAALLQRLSRVRSMQEVPHPEILAITDADFKKMMSIIDDEEAHWRSALALKLYFTTGAKLRRVLRARWDQIIDTTWYPYSPQEREYWFMGAESLDDVAKQTLERAQKLAVNERIDSAFIFPSAVGSGSQPITTVRRYWLNLAITMGWEGLPLSHVVQRFNRRNTPSYIYMYRYLFVPMRRAALDPAVLSKIV